MIDIDINKDERFSVEFWKWFDTLSKDEKNRFWYYSADMARLYFYNKHYAKVFKNRLETDSLRAPEVRMEVSR